MRQVVPTATSSISRSHLSERSALERVAVRPCSVLRGWSSRLDGDSKLSEHLDGAGLPALEITGGKALARVAKLFMWVLARV
jgi:hypothetical protein